LLDAGFWLLVAGCWILLKGGFRCGFLLVEALFSLRFLFVAVFLLQNLGENKIG
jgi:hypothetical protein